MNLTDIAALAPRKARVEIIPLIDVIFFLLATFVLFTLSLDKIGSVVANMPKPGDPTENRDVTLQANDAGVYWKEGDAAADFISWSEVRPRLVEYKGRTAVPRVSVHGDKSARLGGAVRLLDEIRLSGIEQVALLTVVRPTGS